MNVPSQRLSVSIASFFSSDNYILSQASTGCVHVQMNAEKCPFLTDRLNIWMLPTLAIVRSEKTTDYVVGFDELGGTDDFETETLRQRLAAAGAVDAESAQEDDDLAALTGLSSAASGKAKKGDASSIRRGHGYKEADDEDSDDLAD